MKSTPSSFSSIIRLTAFPPAPPTPITFIRAPSRGASSSSNLIASSPSGAPAPVGCDPLRAARSQTCACCAPLLEELLEPCADPRHHAGSPAWTRPLPYRRSSRSRAGRVPPRSRTRVAGPARSPGGDRSAARRSGAGTPRHCRASTAMSLVRAAPPVRTSPAPRPSRFRSAPSSRRTCSSMSDRRCSTISATCLRATVRTRPLRPGSLTTSAGSTLRACADPQRSLISVALANGIASARIRSARDPCSPLGHDRQLGGSSPG